MTFIRCRVYASDPDEAAMKIRDEYKEYEGALTITEVNSDRAERWFEYTLELTS